MLETVARELKELGFEPRIVPSWGGAGDACIVFEYPVQNGRLKGRTLQIGVSFQEAAYPEYPPHFVHVRGLDKSKLTKHSGHEFEGAEWWAFSVPPSDFWDDLEPAQKNMRTYVKGHLPRVLEAL